MPSKLEQLQLQFRQRLNEERMIKIHTDNQQKALSKISRYTNGYQNSTTTPTLAATAKPPVATAVATPSHHSPIKKGSPGVDRSRPLPPISKEQKSFPSTRSSPEGSPIENNGKTVTTPDARSRSVDLELKNKPSGMTQNGKNGYTVQRNGYAKPTNFESKCQATGASDKKPNQDTLSKLKQAELQRIKANTKAKEEPVVRNGSISNGSPVKVSTLTKKPIKTSSPPATTATPSKPRIQGATSNVRRTNPTTSKPTQRTAQANAKNEVARKPPGPGQEQCTICGRNFNQDRIEKHVSICKKAAQKKVKVFDATKMRVKGTEAEQFVKKGLPKKDPKPKKSDWRKKHNDFIEAIRQAKMVQQHLAKGGKVSDLPPPPPSDTSDYVPCPHCGRKFSEGVAERHIPKCKNILSNKKNPNAPTRRK